MTKLLTYALAIAMSLGATALALSNRTARTTTGLEPHFAADGAFRDGLYLGKLAAQHGRSGAGRRTRTASCSWRGIASATARFSEFLTGAATGSESGGGPGEALLSRGHEGKFHRRRFLNRKEFLIRGGHYEDEEVRFYFCSNPVDLPYYVTSGEGRGACSNHKRYSEPEGRSEI